MQPQAAVLIAVTDRPGHPDGPGVLMIQRPTNMRAHPGQAAFPGGKIDPGETPALSEKTDIQRISMPLRSISRAVLSYLRAISGSNFPLIYSCLTSCASNCCSSKSSIR